MRLKPGDALLILDVQRDFCAGGALEVADADAILPVVNRLIEEAAKLLHVSDGYLRQLSLDGIGPAPEVSASGRRSYTLAQINELRGHIATAKPREALSVLPHRRAGEKMQTIACVNFKGGSAKTTTCLYLAQYLAMSGFRVLAVDLDPQASLSAMLGLQPEFRGRVELLCGVAGGHGNTRQHCPYSVDRSHDNHSQKPKLAR